MDFATQHKDEPFFTYIACNAPHSPFNVANRYSDRYTEATRYLGEEADDRANFYGMVTCIDDNVQRMRDHLDDLGARPPAFCFRSSFRSVCFHSWVVSM